MPRLIVDDAGKRKAFRVTQGRLSVGSGADAKLSLTAGGVEEHHANLLVSPEGVKVQVLAPVTVGGEKVLGGEIDLEFGSALAIGEAKLMVEADEAAPKAAASGAAAPKRSGAAPRRSSGGGAQRTKTRGTRGDDEAPSRSSRGGRGGRGGAGGGRRRSGGGGRATEKQGLPPAAKFGGIVAALALAVFVLSKFGGGSAAANAMTAAASSLENGNLETARTQLDSIQRSKLEGEALTRFDELLADLEGREAYKAEASERIVAIRYIDDELKNLIAKQFKTDPPEKAKVRLLMDRIADFRATYPKHSSEVWLTDSTYAADHQWLLDAERKYGSIASTSEAYTRADADFRAYFFLDSKPRRYNLVMPIVAAAKASATDATDSEALDALQARLTAEQKTYADERIQDAAKKYQDGDMPGAARVLMTDVQTLTDAALINRAATTLIGLDQVADLFKGMKQGKGSLVEEYQRLLQIPTIRTFADAYVDDDEPADS